MNLDTGYMQIAGIGGIGSNMGWTVSKTKQLAPRLGLTYQYNPKTVIRAGYGRSFDTGVFGSIFGHTVTQNIPVLANQAIPEPSKSVPAFTLAQGPAAYVGPRFPPPVCCLPKVTRFRPARAPTHCTSPPSMRGT